MTEEEVPKRQNRPGRKKKEDQLYIENSMKQIAEDERLLEKMDAEEGG